MITPADNRKPAAIRDESGFAIVIVLLLLVIGLAIGAAALSETLDSQSQAAGDQRYNRALQAADAGVNTNLYQLNEINLSTLNFNGGLSGVANLADCLLSTGSGLSITSSIATAELSTGVCPTLSNPSPPVNEPANAVPVGDHAYYATAAVPTVTSDEGASSGSTSGHTELGYKIYSYGWDDGGNQTNTSQYQIRKVEETVAPADPFETIEGTGNVTTNGILVLNGDLRADGNLTENAATILALGGLLGSVNVSAINALDLLGPTGALINTPTIEYGNGKTLTTQSINLSLTPTPTQMASSFSRSTVTIAPSAPDCSNPTACAALTAYAAQSSPIYNSTTDLLSDTAGSSTVTLPGGDYVFCGFEVDNANVVASTTSTLPVRIFIDSPTSARCSSDAHTTALGNFIAKDGVSNAVGTTALSAITGITQQLSAIGGSSGLGSVITSLLGSLLNTVNSLVGGLTDVTLSGANLTGLTATSQLQIYDAGSTSDSAGTSSPSTKVTIGGSSTVTQAMFVYAPDSNVTMETTEFSGNIIGDNVTLTPANGTAMVVLQDLSLADSSLANSLGTFHISSYEECSSPSWSNVLSALASPTLTNLASGC